MTTHSSLPYLQVVKAIEDRPGSSLGKIFPGQNWIELSGTYTPDELETIAAHIRERHSKVPVANGDKN